MVAVDLPSEIVLSDKMVLNNNGSASPKNQWLNLAFVISGKIADVGCSAVSQLRLLAEDAVVVEEEVAAVVEPAVEVVETGAGVAIIGVLTLVGMLFSAGDSPEPRNIEGHEGFVLLPEDLPCLMNPYDLSYRCVAARLAAASTFITQPTPASNDPHQARACARNDITAKNPNGMVVGAEGLADSPTLTTLQFIGDTTNPNRIHLFVSSNPSVDDLHVGDDVVHLGVDRNNSEVATQVGGLTIGLEVQTAIVSLMTFLGTEYGQVQAAGTISTDDRLDIHLQRLGRVIDTSCSLCTLDIYDSVLFENTRFVCLPCCECQRPLWIVKNHNSDFTDPEKQFITDKTQDLLGSKPFRVKWLMGSIPGHAHAHVNSGVLSGLRQFFGSGYTLIRIGIEKIFGIKRRYIRGRQFT